MSPPDHRWGPASLLIVAALYGWVSGHVVLPGIITIVIILSLVTRRRAPSLSPWIEAGLALATIGGGALAALLIARGAPAGPALSRSLGIGWSATAAAALSFAAGRLYLRAPRRGAAGTAAAGLLGVAACGGGHVGPVYVAAIVAYLSLALLAMRGDDRGRPALRRLSRRGALGAGAGAIIALAMGSGAAAALPPLYRWTTNRVVMSLSSVTVGFSERLWLGSLEGMLSSDEPILRLRGPRTDYLRGAVYDRYYHGRWDRARAVPATPFPSAPASDSTERVVATMLGGAQDRYFLPLNARAVATSDDSNARLDRYGILHTRSGEASSVSFEPRAGADPGVAAPGDDDLAVPEELRRPLEALVTEWTAGMASPAQRLHAITQHLRTEFRYSLQFKRGGSDPLLDFLVENRQGHCEYFASAAALLARTAGIPARVVGGYRVAEQNPIDGDYIVREQNAHAWVEAYLPGAGWQTVDATPESSLPQNAAHETPLAGAIYHLAASAWARLRAAVRLGPTLAALGAVIAMASLARLRRLRARAPGAGLDAKAPADPPLPSFPRLLGALAGRGVRRSPAEPIERFSNRVEAAGLADAADVLRRYAALRYGGLGEAGAISQAMDRCAALLKRP